MIFTLNISLPSAAVSTINGAGQKVTLAQEVTAIAETGSAVPKSDQVTGDQTPVAWLTFSPFENNTVGWSGALQFYATTTPLDPGAVLAINSRTAEQNGIQLGSGYTFANGVFTPATGVPGAYVVENQQADSFSFGLLAAATLNGTSATGPLDALPMLSNQDGFFYPPAAVYIFLSSASQNGTVLPVIPSGALELDLTSGSLDADVCFNDTTNEFFVCSN
jgi:hypothetical protein